jgi:hypothetical protein
MPGPKLGFDGRNLLAAAVDSRGHLPALLADLVEGASVAVKRCLLSRERLPSL